MINLFSMCAYLGSHLKKSSSGLDSRNCFCKWLCSNGTAKPLWFHVHNCVIFTINIIVEVIWIWKMKIWKRRDMLCGISPFKKRENYFNNLANSPIICQLLVNMRKVFKTFSGRNIKFSHVQNSQIICNVSLPCEGYWMIFTVASNLDPFYFIILFVKGIPQLWICYSTISLGFWDLIRNH